MDTSVTVSRSNTTAATKQSSSATWRRTTDVPRGKKSFVYKRPFKVSSAMISAPRNISSWIWNIGRRRSGPCMIPTSTTAIRPREGPFGISESFSSSSLSPSPPCSAQSSRSPSCVVPESFSSSPPSSSPSPPCSAISSSPPCCVVSESCSSSSPLLSPSCNQLSLCYPSSTVSGCSTPSTDDHGASRAVVPRTWGRTNVWTPYLTVPPSTPTGCSTPPTDDHGASRAIVRRASRNSIIGTPYLTVPPSTPAGSFSLPPGDHGASQAIVRRASRNSIVGTPSRTALPSTPARSFSLPMNDHGTPRALVRQPSGNSVVRTPSLNQTSSLSTIVEESSSSGASGSQRKGVPGTALAKHGSCPVCRTRNLAPPPPPLPSPCSSGSSSWSSSCSCSCSSSSSSGTPSPPLAKPPSNTP
ncbi:hypothetical protein BC567DRAFT_253182, partial [Phyllosticta citribraziliensis]